MTPTAADPIEHRAPPAWRRALAEAVTEPRELLDRLGLPMSLLPAAERAAALFGLRVPLGYLGRMRPGDAADPLLRQVMPLGEELSEVPGWTADPLAESEAAPRPGVLHKYRGRVLLVVTGACAVHCRYCFRRHYPYADAAPGWSGWTESLRYVEETPDVREVILSGGDPLSASDERLAELVSRIEAIPHVARLRLHTRNPVVLPERVDDGLLAWLGATRLATVVVVHANHANEIDGEVGAAFARLRRAGATVLNQSVLLAGVNDSADALAALSEALFAAGALPYYLHLLDRVRGAAHFDVPEERGRRLVGALAARLPGFLVPRLVREVPGAPAKVAVAPILP